MNRGEEFEFNPSSLRIPTIKADSETQTSGQLRSHDNNPAEDSMEQSQAMNIRKRRTLSKNRGQTRQREKTPEPGRTPVTHEDTTTSDDEDFRPNRSSREIDADTSYEEMKKMVQEKSGVKDPVYDMDTQEILEARAMAANERRRRSISPFAIPDKDEICQLQRKGSFIDPSNRFLTTTYTLSPKEEDTGRRNSLTIDTARERKNSLTGLTPPLNASPKEKAEFQYSIPTTPKKLEKMVYPDERRTDVSPAKKENIFSFDTKEDKPKVIRKSSTPKLPEAPVSTGEIVTKVIQVERTPSKKLADDRRPSVDIRQRVVRTPSRKSLSEKPTVLVRREPREVPPSEVTTPKPPVKPVRSRSASRFGGKTSESEMSEDQGRQLGANPIAPRRKVVPTPRRFIRNRSPRANRSQSVNRVEDLRLTDKTGTGMSQTSKEIIELMEQARARSLSITKDDPRVPADYTRKTKTLATPNKTPTTLRQSRGISCPKTIQIISDKDILDGLIPKKEKLKMEKSSAQSSGYIDASQSEYTSSCYSSSPSDNEYNFDLAEKTAELTRKLHLLSQEKERRDRLSNIILAQDDLSGYLSEPKSELRKRTVESSKKKIKKVETDNTEEEKKKKPAKSRCKLLANWRQFKEEHKAEYQALIYDRNRCIADLLLLVITCGLGGMMFKTLEGSFENAYKCSTRNVKRDFIESLWRGSSYMREEDWKSMARKKLFEFEDQLHTAHEAGVTSYSGQRSWNFMNSFVYCLTLITTIGYGHIAPKTTYGRVATIVYAVIGIPLFLIVLADFGKLFTRIIKFFWAFIRRFYYTRSCRKVRTTVPVQEVMKGLNIVYDAVRRPSQIFNEGDIAEASEVAGPPIERKQSDGPPPLPPKPGTVVDIENDPETPAPSLYEIDDEFNLPISVAIVILVIYIIIGAVGYNMWETWNFFESFYFVFISMSTIGLGDLVPDHPMFMMASILYLVFGLALTSMCINVVQVKLSDTFKQASAKIGATIGLKVAEEDGSLVAVTPPPMEVAPVHKPKKVDQSTNDVSGTDS